LIALLECNNQSINQWTLEWPRPKSELMQPQ